MWTLPLLDVDVVALLEARGEPHPSAVAVAVIVAGQCQCVTSTVCVYVHGCAITRDSSGGAPHPGTEGSGLRRRAMTSNPLSLGRSDVRGGARDSHTRNDVYQCAQCVAAISASASAPAPVSASASAPCISNLNGGAARCEALKLWTSTCSPALGFGLSPLAGNLQVRYASWPVWTSRWWLMPPHPHPHPGDADADDDDDARPSVRENRAETERQGWGGVGRGGQMGTPTRGSQRRLHGARRHGGHGAWGAR